MTENLKKTLTILLDTYKENKIDKEEILTILETILNNNCSCGTNVVTYPMIYPSNDPKRNWWDDLPQWTVTSTSDSRELKQDFTKTNV